MQDCRFIPVPISGHFAMEKERGVEMGIKTLKAEFDLLWARVEESSLENEFLDYLRDQYDLWDFEQARDIVKEEVVIRV